ncbi:DNA polymerase I-like protein with 3'-5' exonuclease and polymerase domains [Clostridium beijerinckii]|uniref:DNA polymerase n=1 Tax=Clostridium beijerinckii TaxID=1520 RepID=UPI0014940C9F|nr:DNA polymerase [Clostridium beijerinckii]NOW85880.1 DNA polymerase I-like protein with 3'-5' exonuclease and polymerase domains [Clostridium beijerinckii]
MNKPKLEMIFMDLETNSLNPRNGKIKLIVFAKGKEEVVYKEFIDEDVREILEDPNFVKVFHNAKFDVGYLINNGCKVNNYHCTLTMAQVLEEDKLSLKALSKKYLDIDMDKSMQHSDNWKVDELTQEHIDYAVKDVENTRELYYRLIDLLLKKNLLMTYERERKALPAIVMLENNGIKMEFDKWNTRLDDDRKLSIEIESTIKDLLNMPDINLNSPKQLVEALSVYGGIKLYSTSDDELAKYSDEYEAVKLIRKYRKLQTKIKTYGEKLESFIEDDGRIRADWRLIGASSGRMSCNNPPLQAMPGNSREFFVAEEGHLLVVADYSQVELRVLASISNDETLINYFKDGVDLHTGTASLVFKKPLGEITKEERQVAKSLNFGIVYGITPYGIQKNLRKCGIYSTLEEAEQYRLEFLNVYSKVRELQDALLRADYIKTLGGRRWQSESLTLTQRLNLPIQGSAAEGLKEALALLTDSIKDSWKLVAVVHDEILLEVPEEDANEAKDVLEKCMISGMENIIRSVPVIVDSSISNNWCK